MIEVPSEAYISIVSQYMSTVMELAFDNSMHRVAAYTKGRFGIIDVRGGTILVNSTIYTMPFPIEQVLRTGNSKNGYIYTPNQNEVDKRNITSIIEKK